MRVQTVHRYFGQQDERSPDKETATEGGKANYDFSDQFAFSRGGRARDSLACWETVMYAPPTSSDSGSSPGGADGAAFDMYGMSLSRKSYSSFSWRSLTNRGVFVNCRAY